MLRVAVKQEQLWEMSFGGETLGSFSQKLESSYQNLELNMIVESYDESYFNENLY